MDDELEEVWTHKRIRQRLSAVIEVLPTVNAQDQHSRTLLKNIHDDLRQIRAGLDQLAGDYK